MAGGTAYMFELPNIFNEEEYGTHGIIENLHVYKVLSSGLYEAPTDWTIYIVFNTAV